MSERIGNVIGRWWPVAVVLMAALVGYGQLRQTVDDLADADVHGIDRRLAVIEERVGDIRDDVARIRRVLDMRGLWPGPRPELRGMIP